MDFLLISIGFVFLVLGANTLIDGAASLARRFKISDMIIGLTIVAFGTSLPELVVTLLAVVNNSTDIAITNVVGSNIVNTLLILGCSAVLLPIKSDKLTRRLYVPLSLLAPILIFVLLFLGNKELSICSGLVFLSVFVCFLYSTVVRPIAQRKKNPEPTEAPKKQELTKQKNLWVSLLFIIVGLVLLTIGGQMLVSSAVNLAKLWGISEAVIGLTIVAVGTSLPELATSLVAAAKKNSDIALGNIIGSNIFNVFFILGISATIKPIPTYNGLSIDLFVAALSSLLIMVFIYTNKKRQIMRWEGALLCILYFVYLFYLLSKFI